MRLRRKPSGIAFSIASQKMKPSPAVRLTDQSISALIDWLRKENRDATRRSTKARLTSTPARFRQATAGIRAVVALVWILAATGLLPQSARAEVGELRLARQYGISHLAMALMDQCSSCNTRRRKPD
jgi:hypothetical protein